MAFPNPVNERAAHVVRRAVAVLAAVQLASGLAVVAGATRGRVSPAGGRWAEVQPTRPPGDSGDRPTTRTARIVPGPPKRFAQSIGLAVTTAAAVCSIVLGWSAVAFALIGVLVVFAVLESAVGFCAGCWVIRFS